ncbi:MAG: hypothetical protein QM813_22595 [Verrucomicrobiota bacterium]
MVASDSSAGENVSHVSSATFETPELKVRFRAIFVFARKPEGFVGSIFVAQRWLRGG